MQVEPTYAYELSSLYFRPSLVALLMLHSCENRRSTAKHHRSVYLPEKRSHLFLFCTMGKSEKNPLSIIVLLFAFPRISSPRCNLPRLCHTLFRQAALLYRRAHQDSTCHCRYRCNRGNRDQAYCCPPFCTVSLHHPSLPPLPLACQEWELLRELHQTGPKLVGKLEQERVEVGWKLCQNEALGEIRQQLVYHYSALL